MSEELRADVVSFGTHYCAVIRRAGQDDDFLVDEGGRARRFASATAAFAAGRAHLRALAPAAAREEPASDAEPVEVRTWRSRRAAERHAERERVFGADDELTVLRGNILVERRRRRR